MKALYSRKELAHISFNDIQVPLSRYLYKFENQRKEIARLKLHEKDFLFRAMRSLHTAGGGRAYNVYRIPELKECLFYWLILLHSNINMQFEGYVPGPGHIPLTVSEKRKNKRYFYECLQVWKNQISAAKGPYMSVVSPAINEKLKNWREYAAENSLSAEKLKQKEIFIYACFFDIYYHVKLYFDELPQPYVMRRINGFDVVFNVYSYVHIYSRHYIPNMNQDLGTVSLNPEIAAIDLDELPDSIFSLLERYNESNPIKTETEYCLFTHKGSCYILWLKYKKLNETKDYGLEVRSFYRCTEERDIEKFKDGISITVEA